MDADLTIRMEGCRRVARGSLNSENAASAKRYRSVLKVSGRACAIVFFMGLTACGSAASAEVADFVPQRGFAGYSQGDGTSRIFFGPVRAFHVESHGYDLPDGAFRLDQTMSYRDQSATFRFWIIKTVGNGRFWASVSDAPGQVTGHADGPRLFLRYRVKGPFVLHQRLELMTDGKTIENEGRITLLGIPIGWLHETITRKD